jgi:hypothetical protein
MLQRVQTLFLLGAVLISVLLLYIPVFELFPANADVAASDAGKPYTISINTLLMIINGAVCVLTFLAIWIYKKRNFQIRLCNLAMLLTCILIALLLFLSDSMSGLDQKLHYKFGIYLPIIQILFIFLAARFIKRDENLVRSADRLR